MISLMIRTMVFGAPLPAIRWMIRILTVQLDGHGVCCVHGELLLFFQVMVRPLQHAPPGASTEEGTAGAPFSLDWLGAL